MTPTRSISPIIAFVCLTFAGAVTAAAQDPPAVRAIVGVTVVDTRSGTLLPDRTVVLEDGRIRSVEPGGAAPAGAAVIDGAGRYLIPGLWDMHVHLRHDKAPEILMPQFVAHGVTGVRDMASDCDGPEATGTCIDRMREWQEEIAAGELLGPRILALSSFPLNPPWDYDVTSEQITGMMAELDRRGVDLIKVYFRLSPEAFAGFVAEARRLGIDAGGHLPLRMTAAEASAAGLRSLEHARDFLFDCFPGSAEFRQAARSQNPPVDVMRAMVEEHDPAICERTFAVMVENDTWYVPTHVTRRMDAYADDPEFRADPRLRFIPAEARAEWQADADRMVALDPTPEGRSVMRGFYETGLEITGRAHAAGVGIVLGTDAGDTYVFPGSGAHDELEELVKAGLTPAEALAAATVDAARFLRLEAEHGTVEAGKRADLVLLSADPLADIGHVRDIEMVFLGGRPYDRAELDAMLQGVEEAVAAAAE